MKGEYIVLFIAVFCLLLVLLYRYCGGNFESFAGDKGYYQITWDPPKNTGGSPIDKYSITIKDGDDVVEQADTTDPIYNFGKDDITVGKWNTDYNVEIIATNKNGISSDTATYSFNSSGPAQITEVSYFNAKNNQTGVPITINTPISDPIEVTFKSDKTIKFTNNRNKVAMYLSRDGSVVCKEGFSFAGKSTGLDYRIQIMGFSCQDIDSNYQSGDKITFTMEYETEDGNTFNYADSGIILKPGKPDLVENIKSKYIS